VAGPKGENGVSKALNAAVQRIRKHVFTQSALD
jgi:hypothetical protein